MATKAERQALVAAYSGDAWKKRVDNMTDSQVLAVYMRLKQQGKVQ
jgi:hypothetical protein